MNHKLLNELNDKRIRIITGHTGSGKTEFAINYAIKLKTLQDKPIAIVDLDIINVYFRSRQREQFLEKYGIEVISSSLGNNSILDLPALSANINKPLNNKNYNVIIDLGGDTNGARVIRRFIDSIKRNKKDKEYDMFYVTNFNRPQTQNFEETIEHIKSIEQASELKVTSLVSNTHLLRETKKSDIVRGHSLSKKVSKALNVPVRYICYLKNMKDNPRKLLNREASEQLFPIELNMREDWM